MEKLQQVQPSPTREKLSKIVQFANAVTNTAIAGAYKIAETKGMKWALRSATVLAAMSCFSSCAGIGGMGGGMSIPTRNGPVQFWGGGDNYGGVPGYYNGGAGVVPVGSYNTGGWQEIGRWADRGGYVSPSSPRQVIYR